MAKSFVQELGERLASVESRLSSLSSGNRLDHASLDGTTLYLRDADGNLSGRLGRQPDGSNGVHVVRVQPPPQLTAAILTVGEQAGTCLVEWDGNTFDGRRMPLIHGHTEVWAELVGEDWDPTVAPGDNGKRVGTIRDRTGGEVTVALPQAGTWAVWLRAMGADRETAGPWSPVSQVEIKPLVDTEAIEAELEDARDRITEADERLTAGQGELDGKLGELDERVGPGVDGTSSLTQALTTGLDDVYREAQQYAESQADNAVNQAASNAQSEYDRLQEIAERALSRAGDNVLEDPSFETDYWINNLNLVDRDAWLVPEARTGDYALAIGGGTTRNLNFATVDVEPDDSWRLSVWYRSPDGDEPNHTFTRLRLRDGATNDELDSSANFIVEGDYTRAVVTVTIPEQGVTSLNAVLIVNHTEGTLVIDDIAFQEVGAAAEALRLAEVARQEAEAAHIAAGDAVDAAASAWDRAGSQGSILGGLTAPVGVAPADSYWIQWDSYGEGREPIAVWKREGGSWVSQPLDPEFYPLVDIGAATIGDLHGDRITASTVKAGALAVMPDAQDYAPNPGNDPDLWTLAGASIVDLEAEGNPSGVAFRLNQRAGDSQVRGPVRPVTPGKQIRFRGYYTYDGDPSDVGVNTHARMEWFVVPEGGFSNRIGWDTLTTVSFGSSEQWVEGIVDVPEGALYGRLYIYQTSTSSSGEAMFRGTMMCEPMVQGVMIEPEGIKSPQVDTAEFFAAEAVIQKVWTDIVRSRLVESQGIITEDMIATGAITTPKLTVTEEMVGEVAKLLRIEAGSLASNDIEAMRIVSSLIEATTYLIHNADGDVSVRLDGMNNYLAGSLHAGMDEDRGIRMDYGQVGVHSGWNDEDETWESVEYFTTPFVEFQTHHDHAVTPKLWVGENDGHLRLTPGVVRGGNVPGELRIYGATRTNRLYTSRIDIPTTSGLQPGGMERDGPRTRLHGRQPDTSGSLDMFTSGQVGPYIASNATYRGTVTWANPPELGTRTPILTARLSEGALESRHAAYVHAGQTTSSSFRFQIVPSSNHGREVHVNYNCFWQ